MVNRVVLGGDDSSLVIEPHICLRSRKKRRTRPWFTSSRIRSSLVLRALVVYDNSPLEKYIVAAKRV